MIWRFELVVIDEERLRAFAQRQMRSFSGSDRELPQVLMTERGEHIAPVVLAREAPDGRPENVILPPFRVGEESAAPQRIRQAENAAAIDAEQLGQLAERYRVGGFGNRLENEQTTIQTLDRRRVRGGAPASRPGEKRCWAGHSFSGS